MDKGGATAPFSSESSSQKQFASKQEPARSQNLKRAAGKDGNQSRLAKNIHLLRLIAPFLFRMVHTRWYESTVDTKSRKPQRLFKNFLKKPVKYMANRMYV
jgi:hypothetical protein